MKENKIISNDKITIKLDATFQEILHRFDEPVDTLVRRAFQNFYTDKIAGSDLPLADAIDRLEAHANDLLKDDPYDPTPYVGHIGGRVGKQLQCNLAQHNQAANQI